MKNFKSFPFKTKKLGLMLTLLVLSMFLGASVTACAVTGLTKSDENVITQLSKIAPKSYFATLNEGPNFPDKDVSVQKVACWKPSENLVEKNTFRVLCRVFYDQKIAQQKEERYQDMICIGDTNTDPVSEYCYPWAYYSDNPKFEDQKSYFTN